MPKISVIMGVYNCKNYEMLKKSVISIINQTYNDWEFIICDDGSINNTEDMLHEIAKLDRRIKIIGYKENRGLANALNCCIKEATGEYIARQDDDDISHPTRFEKQIKFIEYNNEYSIVGTIANVFDDSGIWGKYRLDEVVTKNSFLWNSPFLHPSLVIRKSDLEKVGGYRVAKETRRCEDYDLWMRMYAVGMKGYNLQEVLFNYRIDIDPEKKYRPMKYRIDEAIVRYKGFKAMGILLKGIPYIFKPFVIGLIPQCIFKVIRKKQYE